MQQPLHEASRAEPSLRSPVILVVEDEVLVRASIAQYLRECGFTVLEAVEVDEALQMIQTNLSIEGVFSDVKLPGSRTGVDLALILRKEYPKLKVLLTSGVAPFPEVEGVALLKKPYFLFEVERRLKSLLGLAALSH